jgi:acyl-CoA thioesterase-1
VQIKYLVLLGILLGSLPAAAEDPRTLLVLGDSLSAGYGIDLQQGWVTLLQQRLDRSGPGSWRVVNASISGDTSAGGLARLPALLERERPALVLLALGSNDGLRGQPPGELGENLTRLIRLARENGAGVLLVGARVPPNYGAAYAGRFHQVFHEVAAATGVTLVPFLLEEVALEPRLMQADGYHPNAAAQPYLLDTVWPGLAALLARPAETP